MDLIGLKYVGIELMTRYELVHMLQTNTWAVMCKTDSAKYWEIVILDAGDRLNAAKVVEGMNYLVKRDITGDFVIFNQHDVGVSRCSVCGGLVDDAFLEHHALMKHDTKSIQVRA
jgi:hypothetical protein